MLSALSVRKDGRWKALFAFLRVVNIGRSRPNVRPGWEGTIARQRTHRGSNCRAISCAYARRRIVQAVSPSWGGHERAFVPDMRDGGRLDTLTGEGAHP
jgi:hypothetical protein